MQVKFAHSVIFVKDIEVSKRFYQDLLGIKIVQDCGIFILFEGDFSIHQAKELLNTVYKKEIAEGNDLQGKKNLEIYFECDKLDELYAKLKEQNIEFIHGIEKQSWGQNVFRFYDPDRHVVEIGEPSFKCFDN
jgi:catechol 2,3-dioxygenase-like lactoylglutathione lyase family enzyme